jgi:hypothetical protein
VSGSPEVVLDCGAALREARELIRQRIQLVWLRGMISNRLYAMLARRNLQPTSGKSWLTQRGQRELQRLSLSETPSRIREDGGALLPLLDAQIRRLDVDLGARWGPDPPVQRLTTIPGVGPSSPSFSSSSYATSSASPALSKSRATLA